jgi:hypothetical protein
VAKPRARWVSSSSSWSSASRSSCSEASTRRCAAAAGGSGAAQFGVLSRTLGYAACLVIEQTGAATLFFGHAWGLYAVGAGMMVSFLFIVSGAWLLLVAVESPAQPAR